MSNNHLILQFGMGPWPGTARVGWQQEGGITSWLGQEQGSRHGREQTKTAGHSTIFCRVRFGLMPFDRNWQEAVPASTGHLFGRRMFVCLAGEFVIQ